MWLTLPDRSGPPRPVTASPAARMIAQLRRDATIDTDRIAHDRGPRDNDKFIYAFKGSNVERAHARRVHHAERRLATAERQAVPRPPQPLTFTGALSRRPDDAGPGAGCGTRVRAAHPRSGARRRADRADRRAPAVDRRERVGQVEPVHGAGRAADRAGRIGHGVGRSDRPVGAGRGLPRAGVVRPRGLRPGHRGRRARRLVLVDVGLMRAADLDVTVGWLSVGQRRRLALGVLVARSPDLLLLDEPTDHLSLTLASELEEALGTALGTVIVASHDRWQRRRWTGPELPT